MIDPIPSGEASEWEFLYVIFVDLAIQSEEDAEGSPVKDR
jgi:hypothetical protein